MNNNQYNIIFLAFVSLMLLVIIFRWIDYLVNNDYIVENFESQDTSHTVNVPLTTTQSCQNFCGPQARCAKTGQQCTSDIDCPGCTPNQSDSSNNFIPIPGNNASGKLTFGSTPRYSSLTTDIGTQARIITDDKFSKTPGLSPLINTWLKQFEEEREMFNKQFKAPDMKYMPNYPERHSLTGEFMDDGPLPSNAYLE